MKAEVGNFYGNRLRVRTCGICIQHHSLLLANHHGLYEQDFWAPPGGGMIYGESAVDCIKREFAEETGLIIEVDQFAFGAEVLHTPLHAVELYFFVRAVGGKLIAGQDPETETQLISDVRFMTWKEIDALERRYLHGIFKKLNRSEEIIGLNGYFTL
jgi:8-oxo-dGTP diphosphatase